MSLQLPVNERTPQALAEQLDGFMRQHEQDTDVCKTLRMAREQLRALAWNRYAARHTHASKVAVLCRRHKGHRSINRGHTHA